MTDKKLIEAYQTIIYKLCKAIPLTKKEDDEVNKVIMECE